jgi:hypothetical protein
VSAGWVLLAPGRDDTRNRWIREAPVSITTITADVKTGLLLVGSGQAEGLAVIDYALLSPLVFELMPDKPWQQRPRIMPGVRGGQQRPQIRPTWTP